MKCVGKDPCPSTPYVPLAAPPKPAVSVWAHRALTAGIKTTCEPAVTSTTIKTSEQPRQGSHSYITRGWGVLWATAGILERMFFASPSNTTMANALVSPCVTLWCRWAQLALWAAAETKREPTWTFALCFQIKGKLRARQTLLHFFLLLFESEHTHLQAHTSRR